MADTLSKMNTAAGGSGIAALAQAMANQSQIANQKASVSIAFLHGFWSFIKHYIFKLGFLDGGPGFVIAFGNFEGTFYRYIILNEIQSEWKTPKVRPINKP